jgi:uncharacterized OB-fold protein
VSDYVPPFVLLQDEITAGFHEGAAAGVLRVQRCTACGACRHPPRIFCPTCGSGSSEWRAVSGRGRVWSFVVAHPPLLPAFEPFAPYTVVTVELDEDPTIRIVGNIVERLGDPPGAVDPATVAIGEPVRAAFLRVDGAHFLQWVRDGG